MSVTHGPILRSSRLVLRPVCAADQEPLFALARDEEVARYMHDGEPPSREEVLARIDRATAQWQRRGYGMMAVEDAVGFVGRMGVFHPADAPEPLLVYVLGRASWGQGYATEAVPVILRWMSTAHDIHRLSAQIDPRHAASARIAEKLGATRAGSFDRRGTQLDIWHFHVAALCGGPGFVKLALP